MKKLLLLVIIALSVWIISLIEPADKKTAIAGFTLVMSFGYLLFIFFSSKSIPAFFGIKKKPSVPNDIDLKIQVERELCKAKEFMEWVENENKKLQKELFLLKNPPKPIEPLKLKVGDTVGKFAISKIATGTECDPHHCIDKDGEFYRFTESQIEAMMKLNEKTTA